MYFKLIFLLSFLFLSYNTIAFDTLAPIIINENDHVLNISQFTTIGTMPEKFDISQIDHISTTKNNLKSLKLGYRTSPTVIKFNLINSSPFPLKKAIYINSLNGIIKLYKNINNQYELVGISGTDIPIKDRPIRSLYGAIPFKLNPAESARFIISYVGRHNTNAKLMLNDIDFLEKIEFKTNEFLDFFFGGILLLILYNFFIFIFLKDITYFFYSLYGFSFLSASLTITGKMDHLIPLSHTTISHFLVSISSFTVISGIVFTYHILEIKKHLAFTRKIYFTLAFFASLDFLYGFFSDHYYSPIIGGYGSDIIILITAFTLLFSSF